MRNILFLLLPALLAACQRFARPQLAEEEQIEFAGQSIDESIEIKAPPTAEPPIPPPPWPASASCSAIRNSQKA